MKKQYTITIEQTDPTFDLTSCIVNAMEAVDDEHWNAHSYSVERVISGRPEIDDIDRGIIPSR